MGKPKKSEVTIRNMKLWTIICLIVICIVAVALRWVFVYKLYPLEYKQEITASSTEYSIDKYLVCAVIYTESHFNEDAVSGRGAVGLMQIMPDTGKWAAEKIGLNSYTESMLSNPEVNITIGCWYLSYLNNMFDNDIRKVLAGYNAGPANVKEWIKEDGSLSDIPYEETEKYVKKVLMYYEIYKGLYTDF